jgi:hypothetical protein
VLIFGDEIASVRFSSDGDIHLVRVRSDTFKSKKKKPRRTHTVSQIGELENAPAMPREDVEVLYKQRQEMGGLGSKQKRDRQVFVPCFQKLRRLGAALQRRTNRSLLPRARVPINPPFSASPRVDYGVVDGHGEAGWLVCTITLRSQTETRLDTRLTTESLLARIFEALGDVGTATGLAEKPRDFLGHRSRRHEEQSTEKPL